ncbi:calmodulin-binding transcription activator 4 isoform X2 [Zea mays]|nr:calmodulin-binding transcription activator 4 isoform X2 [Zea mays]XP_035819353.1 calmodulin-binding transcription activator 4 isoform X2 [Zea mays]
MLEPAYEHIVLVQYREVDVVRNYSSQLSNGLPEPLSSLGYPNAICGNQYHSSSSGASECSESHQSYSNLSSVTEVSSYSGNKEYTKNDGGLLSIPEVGHTCLQQNRTDNGNSKNKSGLNIALKKIAEQLSLGEDDDDYIFSNQAHSVGGDNQVKHIQQEGTQKGLSRNIAPSWEDVLQSSSGLPISSIYQQSDVEYQKNSEYHPPERLDSSDLRIQLAAAKKFLLGPEATVDSPSLNSVLRNRANCVTDTISAYDSRFGSSLNPDWQTKTALTFQSNSQGSEITELFDHGHFEHYSREDTTFSLGQTNKFNIREISPEWAFSYEITKVIITGDFLCNPSNLGWAVMFGDSEVPAKVVQPGVLLCHTPLHCSGNLRICITSGNREVCSEFKDFEFRSKPSSSFTDIAPSSRHLKSSEELLILAKFARMLLSGNGNPEVPDGDPQSGQCPKLKMDEGLWDRLIEELKVGCESPLSSVDWILEELLKSKLQKWLSVKLRGFNGTDSISKHDQGIIHLISALGYEWALSSVLSVGVGLNFRDSNGWTALHWAAYFGREKMVAALLAAGASATAVTDPTAQDPVGKTAAFLASEQGHTGLAGYLSEVSLTSYLASLTIEESDVSKGSAEVEAERAVESISQRSVQLHGGTEDELSMKDSLAAVRNAAQAAAHIQNAFRAFSFRKRQQKTARLRDEYGMTQEDIDQLAAASRSYHQAHASNGQFYDKAAVSIQKKYKGWKGRKHFLNMRRNAVKIQAHVRGHQVRKKYRTIVSTVSVLEKVILRWRRKGHGLRGFRAEQQSMVEAIEEDDEEDDDFDDDEAVKIFRRQKVDQAVKEAVSRVLSMVDSTEARMQYRRMLEEFRQATNWKDQMK